MNVFYRETPWYMRSGVTIIFAPPPADIRCGPIVLIYNSGHFGPPYRFGPLGPPALLGLPMASFATVYAVVVCLSVFRSVCPSVCRKPPKPVLYRNRSSWFSWYGGLQYTYVYSAVLQGNSGNCRNKATCLCDRVPRAAAVVDAYACCPLLVCACQCC